MTFVRSQPYTPELLLVAISFDIIETSLRTPK